MAYEVINEKLKVEACRIGDLTMDQVESLKGALCTVEQLTQYKARQ